MRNSILVFALSMVTVLISCNNDDNITTDDPVKVVDTVTIIPTWCEEPDDPNDIMIMSNSMILIKPVEETDVKFMLISNGDSSGVFVPGGNNVTISRKFYCNEDYDVFQWRYTDSTGLFIDWITDTIKFEDQKSIYY